MVSSSIARSLAESKLLDRTMIPGENEKRYLKTYIYSAMPYKGSLLETNSYFAELSPKSHASFQQVVDTEEN